MPKQVERLMSQKGQTTMKSDCFKGKFIELNIPKEALEILEKDSYFSRFTDVNLVLEFEGYYEGIKYKKMTFETLYKDNLKRIKASEKYSNS